MSKRQWLVLLMLFLTYLLLGASMFYHIESPLEIVKVQKAKEDRIVINALLNEHYLSNADKDHHMILGKLSEYCGKSVHNVTKNDTDVYKWDFYNSFYFAYTVVSTIGYGNLAPTNMLGRILMIFYGLIGIPMNGILLSQLGEFFGNVFVRAHKKYKNYKEGRHESKEKLNPLETRRAGLAVRIFMYLIPGFIMFIFFPAFLFSYWEGWEYDEAVYYAFVTLSTIGFGDYVAGQDNTKGGGFFWISYKIFLICWISFGLGYLVMIMGFISRGMRSKRITRIEHKLAMNLKHTQSKIWQEFNKDINYLRRVFNEVYIMKLKPVYRDDLEAEAPLQNLARSSSFPDLRELIYGGLERAEFEQPIHPRRRANSEVAQVIEFEAMNRVVSETDLQRIDKKATFASHAMVQPAELLAHLINAMGYMPPSSEEMESPTATEEDAEQSRLKGIDGFSDKDILAGEKSWTGSGWRIGGEKLPQPRTRAASAIGLTKESNGYKNHQNSEWTWSGPSASKKLRELMTARKNGASNQNKESKSRMPSFSFASMPKNMRPRWFNNPFSSTKNSGEMSRRDSAPADDIETNVRENYLSHTSNSRPMRAEYRRRSAAPHYFTHTGGNLPNTPDSNLLEQTSLADFLRALTALHSRVGAVPEDFINRPQRKMGTASLTPPKLPSLLTLFSPPPGYNSQNESTQSTITAGRTASRRFSLRPVENSESLTPSYQRRGSLMSGAGPRRFSLRPEDGSGTSTPIYQRRGSLIPGSRPRRFSLRNAFNAPGKTSPYNTLPYNAESGSLHIEEQQNPPPYSADPFISECLKKPLVSAEVGPAQDGISLPVRATGTPRRFSLRPAQIGVPPAPPSPKTPIMTRQVPKWKGGMLHRQISELSLQRRVRAFSLGDVHSIRTDRNVSQTSPLALPNATSNLTTINAGRSTQTTRKIEETASQLRDKTANVVPAGILSSKKSDDAKQTSGAISQTSVGPIPSDKSQASQHPQSLNPAFRTGVTKLEQGVVRTVAQESTLFAKDERGSDEGKMPPNLFNFAISPGEFDTESCMPPTPSDLHEKVRRASSSGQSPTDIEMIRDPKIEAKSFGTDSNNFSELQSVVIDKPLSEMYNTSYSGDRRDSLSEVRVDSTGSVKAVDKTARKFRSDVEAPFGRKLSTISQKSTGSSSVDATLNDDERSVGDRKVSTLTQRSIESSSTAGSRKSSTSRSGFDKPRVSVETYKPLMELRIEKPATNPFEQYKATVECQFGKPRESRSVESRKTSTEVKGEVTECHQPQHSNSTSIPSSSVRSEASKDKKFET